MVVTPELLRTFSILEPFPEQILNGLAECSSLQRYARRSVIINAGEPGGFVCFLFEGRLQGVDFTLDGREVGLYFVEKGDFCGEIAVFDEQPQPEFVIALAASTVVKVPTSALRREMMFLPEVMAMLGRRLASKLRHMTLQRSLLSLPNIGQRVCYQLWLLVKAEDEKRSSSGDLGTEIANPPTQKEIAIMLNLSRETVTRVFQALQTRQIVKRDGPSRLIILNPPLLERLANGSVDLSSEQK